MRPMTMEAAKLLKGISWRVLASLSTFLIITIFTGSSQVSLGFSFADFVSKLALYYAHEEFWESLL